MSRSVSPPAGVGRCSRSGGAELAHLCLILSHQLLQLINTLRERKRFAGERAMLGLDGGLAQCGCESLVDFVIREAFGFARVLGFLRGHGQCGQRLGGLPRTQIDDGFPGGNGSAPLPRDEGKIRHGIARGPCEDDAENEQSAQDQQQSVLGPPKYPGAKHPCRTGNDGREGHISIVPVRLKSREENSTRRADCCRPCETPVRAGK